MVAYILPSGTNETAIRRGTRTAMLQRPRSAGAVNRHARPGDALHLRIAGNRENPPRPLPPAICILNAEASFTADGVTRVLSVDYRPGSIEGVHALLLNAEQGSAHDRAAASDRLAVALGFSDYAELWASIGNDRIPFSVRNVIAWTRPA